MPATSIAADAYHAGRHRAPRPAGWRQIQDAGASCTPPCWTTTLTCRQRTVRSSRRPLASRHQSKGRIHERKAERRVPRPRRDGLPDGGPSGRRRATRSPSTTARRAAPRPGSPEHGGTSSADSRPRPPRAPRSSSPASAMTTICARVVFGDKGALAGMSAGAIFVDHTTASAEVAREICAPRPRAGDRLPRCAGLRRPGRRRERQADGHGGRRARRLRPRQAGDRLLCPRLRPDGAGRLRPAHQDGQPDLHRRPGAGPRRGHQLRQQGRPRRPRRWST